MGAAGRGTARKNKRALVAYGAASVTLTLLFPLLPEVWQGVSVVLSCLGAVVCVIAGRRRVDRDSRWPWTLLATALVVLVGANLMLRLGGPRWSAAGRLVDATGNLLILAAALAVIVRRGARDLGGVVDAAVMALATGTVLWALLPHRFGGDTSAVARADLLVVVFGLTGVLGALIRLVITATVRALWWVLAAITMAIVGNVTLAVGGSSPSATDAAAMLFIGAFGVTGLFGLDQTAPQIMSPAKAPRTERLTVLRLVSLGAAVAAMPIVVGLQALMGDAPSGIALAVEGALVATLVMVRIWLLSAGWSRAERALAYQATHDQLTGLANRRQFVDRLRHELARGTRCVVLFCDLDGFKAVNDRYGHDAGDQLLVQVAHRLRRYVPPPGLVSRFGGDEFVVLLVDTTMPAAQATRDRISRALNQPYRQVHNARVGTSIGLTATNGERDPEALLRAADRTMYREKAVHRRPSP